MSKHRAFRPRAWEILEPRAVPSLAGVSTPTGLLGISVTLPRQVPTASPLVQAAFAAFDESYIRAVDSVLLAPGPDGLVVLSSNRAAFNAVIVQSLETLAQQIVLSLGSTSTGPTSTEANQVVDAIVGPGSNSLESQLLALPTSAIGATTPLVTSTPNASPPAVVPLVVNTAEVVRPTNRVPVAEAATPSTLATDPASTSASSSSSSKVAEDVRSAFGRFLGDYFQAVRGVLLTPDATGRVAPKAHRADFDARVGQALQALDARLAATVGRYPATSALAPRISAAIEGQGASSLKAGLASLPTPEGSQAAVVRDFTLDSTKAIARALSLISDDVSKLLAPAGN